MANLNRRGSIPILICVLLASGCAGQHRDQAGKLVTVEELREQGVLHSDKPTALELEARLMSYADRYLSKVAEATDLYQRQVKTKAAREFGLSTFIFPGLAVIGVAAGEDPASNLLDMVVFASLQRQVIEDGWAREVLGDQAQGLIEAQRSLERQAWEIAADVLTTKQQTTLRQTISAWRKANPRQRYVSNVHFDDVAVVRGKGLGKNGLIDSDGLLAPLDKAVQESESLRLLAERGVYLMQRMPPLLLAQTRYVVHEQISPEQIDGLLNDFSGISRSVEGAEKTVSALPAVIARERGALFKEWDQRQAAINATLDRVAPSLNAGKGLTDDVKQAMVTLEQIARDYPETGRVLNETIVRIKDLMIYMDRQPASDLAPKIEALRLLASIGGEVNQLAANAQKQPTDRLRAVMRATYTDLLNEILWRALVFAAAVFLLLFTYRFFTRRYLG